MMKESFPKRKALRLKDYDYSTPGAYFVTFCTHNRVCTLAGIVGAIHESPVAQLTVYGETADKVIRTIPRHLGVAIDRYVIMPNHIHLIIFIPDTDQTRAIRESPLRHRSLISKTVGYIKMNASKEIRRNYGAAAVWQRGFHDHVIRDTADYVKIARYVDENPLRWQLDRFYVAEP